MKTKSTFCHLASVALLTISIGSRAQASFIVNIYQSGGNVVASGSGSINTGALTDNGASEVEGMTTPDFAIIIVGPSGDADGWSGASGPSSFGSGLGTAASSGTGDLVGIGGNAGNVALPEDYTSGDALSGTATWDSTTLSDLGLTDGTYTYTWGSGGTADSFTVNIGQAPAPEPGTVWLLSAGVLGLVLNRIRMRKHSVHT
jgi:hypothetical protein